jgi:hypothetical protein
MWENFNPTWIAVLLLLIAAVWNTVVLPKIREDLKKEIDQRTRQRDNELEELAVRITIAQKRADDAHTINIDQQLVHAAYRERIASEMVKREMLNELEKRFADQVRDTETRLTRSVEGVGERLDVFTKLVVGKMKD